ncbi:hypothetical protein EYF80_020135 [Liparis tanakae]|uniref:Uncharacterized protein n=1 Tax=Liparis tanakae TaxID=230148 RepID=A0A4Z2HWE4_9TELE|nr:hypothetical protein EYF80_020135 [Liparis tanakae]
MTDTECAHSEKPALVLWSPWVLSNVKVLFLSASHRRALCHAAACSFEHGGDVNVTCAAKGRPVPEEAGQRHPSLPVPYSHISKSMSLLSLAVEPISLARYAMSKPQLGSQ